MTDYERIKKEYDLSLLKKNERAIGELAARLEKLFPLIHIDDDSTVTIDTDLKVIGDIIANRQNWLGINPIQKPSDDTTANWAALGTGYAWFNTTGCLTDQPGQYGIVSNIVNGNVVLQEWIWYSTNAKNSSRRFHRGGDSGGWNSTWKEVLYSIDLLDNIYPVGAIYISVSSTSPATLFGGTWEQISGRFLIGAGAAEANTTDYWGTLGASDVNCSAGEMGGEAWHTLITSEMPSHGKHLLTSNSSILSTGNAKGAYLGTMKSYGSTGRGWDSPSGGEYYPSGQYVGGGAAHNNMPPYLAVYMWKRTA